MLSRFLGGRRYLLGVFASRCEVEISCLLLSLFAALLLTLRFNSVARVGVKRSTPMIMPEEMTFPLNRRARSTLDGSLNSRKIQFPALSAESIISPHPLKYSLAAFLPSESPNTTIQQE